MTKVALAEGKNKKFVFCPFSSCDILIFIDLPSSLQFYN